MIRVASVSGLMENVQVQLMLNNYLETQEGYKNIQWKHYLEEEVTQEILAGYDIVFFIRRTTKKSLELVEACKNRGIVTVYCLDDNWFVLADVYSDFQATFGKNTERYNYFIEHLKKVDWVWTYNEKVKKQVSGYTNQVTLCPCTIQLKCFSPRKREDEKIRVGFAGSQMKRRYFDEVLVALEQLMAQNEQIELYVMGIYLPYTFQPYSERVKEYGYEINYKQYAKTVSDWGCDLMLSPQANDAYTASKCPNKYLEITACGAVGIYSQTSLYDNYIKDGENGLYIQNIASDWYLSITKLIKDKKLRQKLLKNSTEDVKKYYDSEHHVKTWIKNIVHKIDEKRNSNMPIGGD